MKRFYSLIFAVVLLAMTQQANAQFTIDNVETKEESITWVDTMRLISASTPYYSHARYRAERAAIRKERNTLEITTGLQGTMTSYNDPWVEVSGGDNSIAIVANLFLSHKFNQTIYFTRNKTINVTSY